MMLLKGHRLIRLKCFPAGFCVQRLLDLEVVSAAFRTQRPFKWPFVLLVWFVAHLILEGFHRRWWIPIEVKTETLVSLIRPSLLWTLIPFCCSDIRDIRHGQPTVPSTKGKALISLLLCVWIQADWATKGKNTTSRLTVEQYGFCYDYGNLVERFQGATHKLQRKQGGHGVWLTSPQPHLTPTPPDPHLPPPLPPTFKPMFR